MITTIEVDEIGSKYVDSIKIVATSGNVELQRIEWLDKIYKVEYNLNNGSKDERIDYSIVLNNKIDSIDSLNLSVRVKTDEISTCTCTLLKALDTLEYVWLKERDTISTVITDSDYSNQWVTIVRSQEKLLLYKTISSEVSYRIYNIHGELVHENENLSNVEILQSQPSGVYMLVVYDQSGDKSYKSRFQIIKIYK
jgi:hypothetical protein